jgi:hypothetical protein
MSVGKRYLAVVAIVSASLVCGVVAAQQPSQDLTPEAMQKALEEFGKPAPEHENFKDMVGEWKTVTNEQWPGMEGPMVTEGTATFRLIMGGRFLQQRFVAKSGDTTYRGLGLHGYDKTDQQFESVWLDNMSTGMMVSKGQWDESQQALVQKGEANSPFGKMHLKTVLKPVDDDTWTMTFFLRQPDGSEKQTMEITYTRQ